MVQECSRSWSGQLEESTITLRLRFGRADGGPWYGVVVWSRDERGRLTRRASPAREPIESNGWNVTEPWPVGETAVIVGEGVPGALTKWFLASLREILRRPSLPGRPDRLGVEQLPDGQGEILGAYAHGLADLLDALTRLLLDRRE